MRVVDVVLDTNDTHQYRFGLELLICEANIPAQLDAPADVYPIFFSPDTVQLSREREAHLLVFVEVAHTLTEHIPRSTRLGSVVADVRIGQHTIEYGVGVARLRQVVSSRHCYAVNLLRNNLEAAGSLAVLRLVYILNLKLLVAARKHTRLKNDGHRFALNQIILKI